MDVERFKIGENSPETRNQGSRVEADAVAERASQQPEQDTADAVAERRRILERAAPATRELKSPLLVRMESLLSEGLASEYVALSKDKKEPFRKEGEVLALWLESVIASGSVKPHEVLSRLERWLLIIEGKDRHAPWLVQEAYVRARRVLKEMMHTQIGH